MKKTNDVTDEGFNESVKIIIATLQFLDII